MVTFVVKAAIVLVLSPGIVFACGRAMRWYALHARERSVIAGLAIALPPLFFAVSIFYGMVSGAELASLLLLSPVLTRLLSAVFALVSVVVNILAFGFSVDQ